MMPTVVLSVHQTLIAAPLISVSLEDSKERRREGDEAWWYCR